MSIEEAIALSSGIFGIVTAIWKIFTIIRGLERQIEEVENELEKQLLTMNGTREKMEHTRSRLIESTKQLHERLSYAENWLTKNTEFNPGYKRN